MLQAFGDVDDSNALFHHSHHTLVFCNYGITQWCDRVMGTAKFDRGRPKPEVKHARASLSPSRPASTPSSTEEG